MTGTVVFKFITPLHSLIISTAPSLITYHSINAMNATTFMDMYVRSFMDMHVARDIHAMLCYDMHEIENYNANIKE